MAKTVRARLLVGRGPSTGRVFIAAAVSARLHEVERDLVREHFNDAKDMYECDDWQEATLTVGADELEALFVEHEVAGAVQPSPAGSRSKDQSC